AFSGTSADAAGLQTIVNRFRNQLGDLNPNVAGSFKSGRREINWDGVPDNFAAPNNMPPNFFNVNSPRGAVFVTPGNGFQVSANANNPTNTPIEFGNLNSTYPNLFATFSPQRLFTARGSTVTNVWFFVPGSNKRALVKGFGAVFTDVDLANTTKIEYFDHNNRSLGAFNVPNRSGNHHFSFLGVKFNSAIIARVRITAGNFYPGPGRNESATNDIVVMDDFIYGEPLDDPSSIVRPEVATATIPNKLEEINSLEKEAEIPQLSSEDPYPNPSSDEFNIRLDGTSTDLVELQVWDSQGNLVESQSNLQPNQIMKIGKKLKPGLYVLKVKQGQLEKQSRLMKR
ncbi:MAG: T9SS type A sorting domain-containing protein, partial [Bacteroidota bacterium]|nr:T9SS type A sorting domain-containing protein [Bacteroidota bacterium]